MTDPVPIDLGLGLADHQLVDSDGRRCGKVDDLELGGVAEGKPHVTAILSGREGWRGRGLLGRLVAAFGPSTVRIPWEDVREVKAAVHLRKKAPDLGLGRGDDRARALVERLPGAR
jgi:sporulation protein YlmC with PRC-barrel domain